MKLHTLISAFLLLFLYSCRTDKQISPVDKLPEEMLPFVLQRLEYGYEIDSSHNPFYIYMPQSSAYLILLKDGSNAGRLLAIHEDDAELISLSKIGEGLSLLYMKPVNHFPAGAALPAGASGACLQFNSGQVRWLFYDGKWKWINPE